MYSEVKPEKCYPMPYGYRAVLKVLDSRQKLDGTLGLVRMQGNSQEFVLAGRTVVLEGVVSRKGFHTKWTVIMEHPSSSSLPLFFCKDLPPRPSNQTAMQTASCNLLTSLNMTSLFWQRVLSANSVHFRLFSLMKRVWLIHLNLSHPRSLT